MKIVLILCLLALFSINSYAKEITLEIIGGKDIGWKNWFYEKDSWSESKRERYGDPYPEYAHMESFEEGVGILRSPDFIIKGSHIKFAGGGWVGVGKKPSTFSLISSSDGKVLRSTKSANNNDMITYNWFVRDLIGEKVYFQAEDNYSNWGYAWLQLAYVAQISTGSSKSDDKYRLIDIKNKNSFGTWKVMSTDSLKNSTPSYLSSIFMGEHGKGIISSPAFNLESKIVLTLRGWDGRHGEANQNIVEVIDEETNQILGTAKPPMSDAPTEVVIDTSGNIGKKVRLQFKDMNGANNYAWFGIDKIDAGTFKKDFNEDISLEDWLSDTSESQMTEEYGIPFLANEIPAVNQGSTYSIPVNLKTSKLYLLGMNHSDTAWSWIGDYMGYIEIVYENDVKETYPILFGEAIWWGKKFYTYPEPFTSHKEARRLFKETARIYPQKPVENGLYISVIDTDSEKLIKSINIIDDPNKSAYLCVYGITALAKYEDKLAISGGELPKDFKIFSEQLSLRPSGVGEAFVSANLSKMADIAYATEESFPKDFNISKPKNYKGVTIEFDGDPLARLMTNVFYHNAEDMSKKVTDDGEYHTSTFAAPWYGYEGVGLYTDNPERKTRMHAGFYFYEAWTRDLGRALSELTFLGYNKKIKDCADWIFKMAKHWEEDSDLNINGTSLPMHIQRILQWYHIGEGSGCFENDGHGLTCLYIYNMWKRMPNKNDWLNKNWENIKGLGNWAVWQLENPEVSKATDSLWSDSEASGWDQTTGYSIYCNLAQIEALLGFAEMAESYGDANIALKWRNTAKSLKIAAENNYVIDDPEYGKTWTTEYAGWGGASILAGIILPTDRIGLDIKNNYPEWHDYNKKAYERIYKNFRPHAFGYGQGFISQAAILFDRMEEAYEILKLTGRTLYNPTIKPYIIPENIIYKLDFSVTARAGDLGNSVQQAEIMKTLRIMAGLDDTDQRNIKIMPRIPKEWTSLKVENMPISFIDKDENLVCSKINYSFKKNKTNVEINISSPQGKLPDTINLRLGAFDENVNIKEISLNGKKVPVTHEKSGDSKWLYLIFKR